MYIVVKTIITKVRWTKRAARKWTQFTWKQNGSNHKFHPDAETSRLVIANYGLVKICLLQSKLKK